jgi:hypothetical protein
MVVALLEKRVESSGIVGRRTSREISDAVKEMPRVYEPKEAPDLEDSTVYRAKNQIKPSFDEPSFLPEDNKSAAPDFSYIGSGVKQQYKQDVLRQPSSSELRKGAMSALEFRHAIRHAIAQSVLRTGERLPPEDKERAVHKLLCEPGAVTLLKYEEMTSDVRNQDYSISAISWN